MDGDESDARLERADRPGPAPGPFREDDDSPAFVEEGLDRSDGLGAATDPTERNGREPRHDEPVGRPLEPVVVGGRDGEAMPAMTTQGAAEDGDVEVTLVVGADEQRSWQVGKPFPALDPRSADELAKDRAHEAVDDLAPDACGP